MELVFILFFLCFENFLLQAYLSVPLHHHHHHRHHPVEDISDPKTHDRGIYLVETCKSVVSAFTCLRGEDE